MQAALAPEPPQSAAVTVTNVDIRFWTMVWLMIKASFAAAIAAFVTSVIWVGVFALFAVLAWVAFMGLAAIGMFGGMLVGNS